MENDSRDVTRETHAKKTDFKTTKFADEPASISRASASGIPQQKGDWNRTRVDHPPDNRIAEHCLHSSLLKEAVLALTLTALLFASLVPSVSAAPIPCSQPAIMPDPVIYVGTEEELRELRHQKSIFEKIRDLDEVLAAVRDNIRPTDFVEKHVIGETGWGTLLDEAGKLGAELSKELGSAPRWLTGTLDKAALAKKIAAGADLPLRLIRAIKNAKTSSAKEKLEDLAQIIKDTKAIVSLVAVVNPVVGGYLTVVTKAIESIAQSAQVIEAATEKTNKVIKEVGKSLGEKEEPVGDTDRKMDTVLDAIDDRIYKIETELAAKAYSEVSQSETACAAKMSSNREAMVELRSTVDRLRRNISYLETSLKSLPAERKALQLLVSTYEREINIQRAVSKSGGKGALEAIPKLRAAEANLKIYKAQLTALEKNMPERQRKMSRALAGKRALSAKNKELLDRFDSCVSCALTKAKYATRGYLLTHFEYYLGNSGDAVQSYGPLRYNSPASSPFSRKSTQWKYFEDFNDRKANTKGLTSAGTPSSSFGKELIDSISGDAWWGPGSLSFEFSEKELGSLPTYVGFVWTDGSGSVTIEVWGPCGSPVKFGPFSGFADSNFEGGRAEDRFFGFESSQGISQIRVVDAGGGIEIDNLEYGREKP